MIVKCTVTEIKEGQNRILVYDVYARQDFRYWLMLIAGLAFFIIGLKQDAAQNCDEAGNCAPWLVYAAVVIGFLFAIGGAIILIRNNRLGSYVDLETNELVWWTQLPRHVPLNIEANYIQRILLSDVTKVKLSLRSDDDRVTLFYRSGLETPFPGTAVIPSNAKEWVEELSRRVPHITIEIID